MAHCQRLGATKRGSRDYFRIVVRSPTDPITGLRQVISAPTSAIIRVFYGRVSMDRYKPFSQHLELRVDSVKRV